MKIVAIIQARLDSKRLPNKVLIPICGTPIIDLILKRLSLSKKLDNIIVATSNNKKDFLLKNHVESLGFICEQGSENNVLKRYFDTASKYKADVIVRITGDCPFVDPFLLDECLNMFIEKKVDYLSNTNPPTFPDGLDISIFSKYALSEAYKNAETNFQKEHVVPYILKNKKFKLYCHRLEKNHSLIRLTVDEKVDVQVVSNVFSFFYPKIDFNYKELLSLYESNPAIFQMNMNIKRNEGSRLNQGQKLWKRSKNVIPGGNMLLSKRPEMFLPEKWPTYFSRSKGCKVWDLEGREYIDLTIMGIGTNSLGYGHPKVDEAVNSAINKGNMSTLNCPEEVYLAEKLIEMHPWASMVRFARTGGEANAIAIRIARAYTCKSKVAFCGYHGWHDWYLATNISDDHLSKHLLPGLGAKGVPQELKNTSIPFSYNNFDQLKNIINKNPDLGIIKMEVERNFPPKKGFLESVRKICDEKNIVLIFDECTSGFRETFGGLHKKYNISPDIAIFGKAIANGYALTAVIGKREIMQSAQDTFVSSTFWTERIGPTAALATLKTMEEIKSWEIITEVGLKIKNIWNNLASRHNLEIETFGLLPLIKLRFKEKNNFIYKTLITQEMLKKGFLASNAVYTCIEHKDDILEKYSEAMDDVFKLISSHDNDEEALKNLIEGPLCHEGFKRLN